MRRTATVDDVEFVLERELAARRPEPLVVCGGKLFRFECVAVNDKVILRALGRAPCSALVSRFQVALADALPSCR